MILAEADVICTKKEREREEKVMVEKKKGEGLGKEEQLTISGGVECKECGEEESQKDGLHACLVGVLCFMFLVSFVCKFCLSFLPVF